MKQVNVFFLCVSLAFGGVLAQQKGSQEVAPALNVILGRPTATSIAMSILSPTASSATLRLGNVEKQVMLSAGLPVEVEWTELLPSQSYAYTLTSAIGPVISGSFRTAPQPGQGFSFTVQGDSHPERAGKMFDAVLYRQTLGMISAMKPDFHIMMGDDFSLDRFLNTPNLTATNVNGVYAAQRAFVSEVGRTAPLFLVNGNHEQASFAFLDGTPNNAAVLAGSARVTYFPLPAPNPFYSGNVTSVEHIGLLRDYYAWTWGDALFAVIDPYWHSKVEVDGEKGGKKDAWDITLGDEQYRWLSTTLLNSTAKYKFVFAHHVQGTGRGGVELADFNEWGGKDRNGQDTFAQNRPGWAMPIHQLFVKSGVSIFFQGHDHLYARQEKDGVIYQEVPNPADPTYTAFNREAYKSGDILPNSGFLRVDVEPAGVKVSYIRSFLPKDAAGQEEVAFVYTVKGPQ